MGLRRARPELAQPVGASALDALGAALEAARGDFASSQVELAADNLHVLGRTLRRIAAGEDARHVFAQTRPAHRASDRLRRSAIAAAYWRALAEGLAAGLPDLQAKHAAVEHAQQHFVDEQITAARVLRVARTYRDVWLRVLEIEHAKGRGPDVAPVRAYLKRHSNRAKVPVG